MHAFDGGRRPTPTDTAKDDYWLKRFFVVDDNVSNTMSLHTRIVQSVTDQRLRLATILGFASVPVTVALSWGTVADERMVAGGTISATAYLVVGFLVGYLYYDRPTERRPAGARAGLAASVGMVVVYLANMVSTLDLSAPRATAFALIGTPLAIAVGVAISVLVMRGRRRRRPGRGGVAAPQGFDRSRISTRRIRPS